MWYERSEDYRPIFWITGRPVYANTLVFGLHILAFGAAALAAGFIGLESVVALVGLDTESVLHRFEVWRLFSYVIFLPLSVSTSIYFIFAMGFLYQFGRQVEEYVGRGVYLKLYFALVLIPALILTLLGFWFPRFYSADGMASIFGVFVAFATIYPGVTLRIWFVELSAAGWAWALLAVLSLFSLAAHDFIGLGAVWCDAAIGFLGMRLIGAGHGLEWVTDRIDAMRTQRLARRHKIRVVKQREQTESIDAILDKIAKHGISSLDGRERAALEQARTVLMKRDQL